MKHNLQIKSSRLLGMVCMLFALLLAGKSSFAQLTGSILIPSANYTSIKDAVDSLNLYGVGIGGVTFDVEAGHREVSPLNGIKLRATGTAGNPIIIRKDPLTSGVNPIITAFLGGSTTRDGVFYLLGSDYVTIDGIDIVDTISNTTPTMQMEWGYALLNKNKVAPFDGCNNNTIINSSITLNRSNQASKGIYLAHHIDTNTTALVLTALGDDNSNNKFYANKIQNVWVGVYMMGFDDATFTFRDKNNDIGGNSYATADTITGLGVGATPLTTGASHGIYMMNQMNPNVSYNYIDNAMGGVSATSIVTGIYAYGSNNGYQNLNNHFTFTHNSIFITHGVTAAALYCANIQNYDGNVTITHNDIKLLGTGTATGGTHFGISTSNTNNPIGTATYLFQYNTAQNFSINNSGGTIYLFVTGSINQAIQDIGYNVINNITRINGTNGSLYGLYTGVSSLGIAIAGSVTNVHDNAITNISISNNSVGVFQAIQSGGNLTANYYNNVVDNITCSNPAGQVAITGILQNSAGDINIYDNTISNINGTRDLSGITTTQITRNSSIYRNNIFNLTSAGAGNNVYGINMSTIGSVYTKVYNNKIYGLTESANGLSTAQGINISNGAQGIVGNYVPVSIYNNIIGDIEAPLSTVTAMPSVIGINVGSGNTNPFNAYIRYNNVYLNGIAGENTNSAAIYHNYTASNTYLNNNLLVNNTVHGVAGIGIACGIMRSGKVLATYDLTSGNNLIYAGTPSSRNLVYFDGTNKDSVWNTFKARVAPREMNSVTQNITMFDALSVPPVTPSSVNYLQNDTTLPALVESGAANIAGITTDMRGVIRQGNPGYAGTGSKPDIGAFESEGLSVDMVYDSVTVIKDTTNAIVNANNQQVVNIRVLVSGSTNALTATQFTVSTNGTANVLDVAKAKLFYCGSSLALSTTAPFGSAVIAPNGTFTFTGSQILVNGANNFWLVYDIAPTAGIGNIVDAEVTNVVVGGVTKTPLNGNPAGIKTIVAPVNGTITVGTSPYLTLLDVVKALNANGISGNVTVEVPANFTETAPAGGYVLGSTILNASLNTNNRLVIQKVNAGANPLLTANTGTSATLDGIFTIQGADFVTIDGIDLVDLNTVSATTQMEWGYGLLKLNNSAPFDGCQNNTIKNSTVTLKRTNTNSKGIYVNNHTIGDISNLIITSVADANSYNRFEADSIQNVNMGIYINGFATSSTVVNFDLYDMNNVIGDASNTGNVIVDFGGAAAGFGINVFNQTGAQIGYNYIDNYNGGASGAIGATLLSTGIQHTYTNGNSANPANVKVFNNQVYLTISTTATGGLTNISVINSHGDVAIDYNRIKWGSLGSGVTSGAFTGINYNSAGASYLANALSFKGNIASDFSFTKGGSNSDIIFNLAGAALTEDISYDTVFNVIRVAGTTAYSGTMTIMNYLSNSNPGVAINPSLVRNVHHNYIYGYNNGSTSTGGVTGIALTGTYTINAYNNTISNVTNYGGTSGILSAIFCNSNSVIAQFYNIHDNIIDTLKSTNGITWGINFVNNGQGANIYRNTISNLTAGGTSTQYLIGIYIQSSGRNFKCYNNKIYGLVNSTTGAGYTSGISLNGAGLNSFSYTPVKFYNNIIGNLFASTATITATPSVMGMGLCMSGTAYPMTDVYHNTISLSGTTGNNANSAGIYLGGTPSTAVFKIANNIVMNHNTPAGTGVASAIHRATGSSISAIDFSSNNNMLHAGTPSPSRLLFYDGVNKDSTILMYQKRMYPRDNASANEDVTFISTDGTSPFFLYPDSVIATSLSNAGKEIQTVSNDYSELTRSATPDIGAYEGNFTYNDVLPPAINYTALSNVAVSQSSVTFTASVKDVSGSSGTLSGYMPRVYYKTTTMPNYTNDAGTFVSGTLMDGIWSFTINSTGLASPWVVGDTIQYYVVAQDDNNFVASAPAGVVATNVSGVTIDPTPNRFVIKTELLDTFTVCETGCDFVSLTNTYGAFDSINKSVLTGDVVLSIAGDLLTETGTIGLNPIAQQGTYRVYILPASATEMTIVGSTTGGLITFNGADRVTLDGRFPGAGNTKYLRIRNRNSGGSTIKFTNDSHLDTVKYVNIEGNTTAVGTVYFTAPAVGGTGNDSNAIMYCDIRDTLGNGLTASLSTMVVQNTALYSEGLMNSENTVAYNNIYNFLYQGVNLGSGGLQDNWVINGNSFYQQPAAAAKGPGYTSPSTQAIQMNVGQGHTITNNSIGGSAPDRSGDAWKAGYGTTSGGALSFKGIEIGTNIMLDRPITISGNTISNIDANPFGYQYAFAGITIAGGVVNVTNNTIGGGAMPYDTIKEGSGSFPSGNGGIVLIGGLLTVENNTIGNYANYLPNAVPGTTLVRTAGINVLGGGNLTPMIFNINNNTIRDIKSNYTYIPTGVPTNYMNPQGTSPAGIIITATTATVNIEGNTIYNITNTSTTGLNNQANGITLKNSSAVCIIKRNKIYGLNASGNGSGLLANGLYGIYVSANPSSIGSVIQNNQISIAPNTTDESNIFGIVDASVNSFTKITNNTVNVGGTALGNSNSYGLLLGIAASITVDSVYNNIFYNGRTGGTASHFAAGAYYMPTVINPSRFGYNLMVSPSANTIMELPAGTSMNIAAVNAMYSTKSSNNNWMETASNVTASNLFTNAATCDLSINAGNAESWYANGKGLPMTNLTNDFANATRSTSIVTGSTDIGAFEVTPSVAPASAMESGAPALNTTTTYTYGGRTVASVTWGAAGTVPTSLDVKYYTGTDAPSLIPSRTHYNAYYSVVPTGGTGYTYNMSLSYDSAMLGTVSSATASNIAYYSTLASAWDLLNVSSANGTTGMLSSGASLPATSLPANFTGTDYNNNPLPVSLMKFAAKAISGDVQLGWTTASEINNNGFEVERSLDGRSFKQIGFVKGARNSSKMLSYGLTDNSAFATTNSNTLYYRLKQVDMDGHFSYSEIVSVSQRVNSTIEMNLYPNPTVDVFTVSAMSTSAGTMKVQVLDIQGKVLMNHSQEMIKGMNSITIDGSPLTGTGIYFVKVVMGNESKVMKLIKQ